MSGPGGDGARWERLAAAGGEPTALLTAALELWRDRRAASAAAVYLDTDGGYVREAACGDPPLPARLTRDGGDEQLALPGGLLVWRAGRAAALPTRRTPHAAEPTEDDAALRAVLAAGLEACRLTRHLKRERFQGHYRGVELEALYDVGLAIASTLDTDTLAREVLLRAVSLIDARRGALYLRAGGENRLLETIGGSARERFAAGAEIPPDLLPGSGHTVAVPIEIEGDERGVLAVADKESRHGVGPFSAEDRRTLELFANQAAIALERARLHREALVAERLARDVELAAEIQRRFLPATLPVVPDFELAGWSRPAREVGGDYYDLLPLAGGRLGIALGDVSGKGVPAALLVSILHSAVRLLLDRQPVDAELLERLNRHVLESSAGNKFITLFLGELAPAAGRLTYINAGHDPALVVRADGAVEELAAGGLPVGMLPDVRHERQILHLGPGDLLCLYSDGITEATSPADEEYGRRRLTELVVGSAAAGRPLAEIVGAIEEAVTRFAAGVPQMDDQTVVLLRRRRPADG